MKKIISFMLAMCLICSMFSTMAFAVNKQDSKEIIYRPEYSDIMQNSAMTISEAKQAIEMIDELAALEFEAQSQHTDNKARNSLQTSISTLQNELISLGAVPLTIEDIYRLHGKEISVASVAPSVPSNTNYVNFYGLTTYITNNGTQYEVFSIVAYSKGRSNANVPVPMFKEGSGILLNAQTYAQTDFSQVLDLVSTYGSILFSDVFNNAPLLNHLSTVWDIATYFNPTATQAVRTTYTVQQTFVYSYVGLRGSGNFDFVQTNEKINGVFIVSFERYMNAIPDVESLEKITYEAKSPYYANYNNAVSLYKANNKVGYTVGALKFKVGNNVVHSFTMPYYSEIWSIPGV